MFRKLVVMGLIVIFARPFPSELQSDFQETKTKKFLNSGDGIDLSDEPEETTYDLDSTLNEDLNLIKKSNLSSSNVTLIEQVEDAGDSTLESPEIMDEDGFSEIFQDNNSTIDLIPSQVTTKVSEMSVAFTTEVTEGIIQEYTTLPSYFQSKHEEETSAIFQDYNSSSDLIPSQETTEAAESLNKQTEDTVDFTNGVKEGIAPEATTLHFFFQSKNEMDTSKTFQDYDGTTDLIMSQGTTEVAKGENAEIFQGDDTTIDLIMNPQATEVTETLNEETEDTVVITNEVTQGINLEYTKMPNAEMISSTRTPILTPDNEAIEGTCEDEKKWCRYLTYNRQACRAAYVKRKCQKTCNDC